MTNKFLTSITLFSFQNLRKVSKPSCIFSLVRIMEFMHRFKNNKTDTTIVENKVQILNCTTSVTIKFNYPSDFEICA